jgi:hypothetical protein
MASGGLLKGVAIRAVGALGLVVVALACSNSDTPSEDQSSSAGANRPAADSGCPVTKPNGKAPPGEPASPRHHGSGRLWTILYYPTLVVTERNVRADGSLAEKFPWWRGVQGSLTIRGERIDASGPAVRAEIPPGYGDVGFQATTIIFASEGCWRVTGTVADESLTFVTRVERAE